MKNLKKRSVQRIWLVTYFCVLIVPILANFFVYNYYDSKMTRQIMDYNMTAMKRVVADVDGRLIQNVNFIQSLELNSELAEIAGFSETFTLEQRQKISEFVMSGIKTYINNLSGVYLYLQKSKAVLRYGSMSDSKIAYHTLEPKPNVGYEEWMRLMNNSYLYDFLWLDDEMLYEVHTLWTNTDHPVNVVKPVFSEDFREIGEYEFLGEGNHLIICGKEGEIIYPKQENLSFIELPKAESGIFPMEKNGDDYMVCYQSSSLTGWNYVVMTPSRQFFENIRNIRCIEIVVFSLTAILGAVMAVVFSKYNYKPLKNTVEALNGTGGSNEYSFIESAVDRMNATYKENIKKSFIAKILTGALAGRDETVKLLSEYGINKCEKMAAVVIKVLDATEFLGKKPTKRDFDALYIALENIFSEMASNYGHEAYMAECDGVIGIMLNVCGFSPIEDMIGEVEMYFESFLRISTIISSGTISDDLQTLSKSYREAREVCSFMEFVGEKGVGVYLNGNENLFKRYDHKTATRLSGLLIEGKSEEALSLIREIFVCGIYKPGLTEVVFLLYEIGNLVLKLAKESSHYSIRLENEIKQLISSENLDMFCVNFSHIIAEFNENLEKIENESETITKIKNYVMENYSNSNLNNSMIADSVSMSVGYLSKFFKEQTGEGLLNYITVLRISHAKKFLAETQCTINEIAHEVGFYNSLALIRAYKKYEGITPTQYREIKNRK